MENYQIAIIMAEHGFRTIEKDNHIFGFIPFIQIKTEEVGEDVTDLTGFTLQQLKEYLGY